VMSHINIIVCKFFFALRFATIIPTHISDLKVYFPAAVQARFSVLQVVRAGEYCTV